MTEVGFVSYPGCASLPQAGLNTMDSGTHIVSRCDWLQHY
jgi:hypothetical protein